jgi:hypothetical protein
MTLPCGCSAKGDLWHELFDECGKDYIVPPRRCCGAPSDGPLVRMVCEHRCCVEFYCPCGVHDLSGVGPAGCRCGHADFRGHWAVAERPKIPTPNGREYTRRMRARRRR